MELELVKDIRQNYDKKSIIKLSDMLKFFYNRESAKKLLTDNPLIYTVLEKKCKYVSYGLTSIEAGGIGKEFFMTRGHYHRIKSAEVYILLQGKGILLIQNKKSKIINMEIGKAYLIPAGYAHRVVNIGNKLLGLLAIYPTAAGHDYKEIAVRGFKKRIIKKGRTWQIIRQSKKQSS